ncbi:MAG: ABC transporter substrate-binding protein [Deltaproteobacteria bacterium]|nr:ABC transporter substrate-binding protein [Deltaproteobacteria bacterium]MBI2991042.1 ABC transporter substrate-binding protein [Deltaproteobacteria bacterium]
MIARCRLLMVLFLALAIPRGTHAAEKVIADFGGLSGFQSASWVAKDLKLFEKYGLDADLVMITGGARSVAALLGGSTQFATGSGTAPLIASARGSDVTILAASYNKFPYAFVAKPDIRSPKELRGKRIGILNFGGSNDIALQLALKEWGIKQQEVNVIVGGDAPTRFLSLTVGRVDATILSPPHLTRAVQAGYRVLADMGEMRAKFSQSTLYVRRGYLRENREIVKRFVKAYSEAVHAIKTDRERTLKVFAKRMRLDDAEILNATYDYYAPRFSFPPRVDMAGIKDTLDFYAERNPEVKNRNPLDFVDQTILDELEKEGFFKALGR